MVDISIHHSKERARNLKALHSAPNVSSLRPPEGNANKSAPESSPLQRASVHPVEGDTAEPHVRNMSPTSSVPPKVEYHMSNNLPLSRAGFLSSLSTRISLINKRNSLLITQNLQWQNQTFNIIMVKFSIDLPNGFCVHLSDCQA